MKLSTTHKKIPLLSITIGKAKELSNQKRQMVVYLHRSDNGYRKTYKQLNIPLSTVCYYYMSEINIFSGSAAKLHNIWANVRKYWHFQILQYISFWINYVKYVMTYIYHWIFQKAAYGIYIITHLPLDVFWEGWKWQNLQLWFLLYGIFEVASGNMQKQ